MPLGRRARASRKRINSPALAANSGTAAPVRAANPRVFIRRRRKAAAGALGRHVHEVRAFSTAHRRVRRRSTANN
jgi:hypothetical protein